MKTRDNLMSGSFVLVAIILFIIMINGGYDFVKNNQIVTIFISTGMLTFVSVFYNLEKLGKMYNKFSQELAKEEKKTKDEIIKGKINPETLRDKANYLDDIDSYKKRANAVIWLWLAVIFYMATIISLLLKPNLEINVTVTVFQTLFFHAGLLFTFYLIFSLIIIGKDK